MFKGLRDAILIHLNHFQIFWLTFFSTQQQNNIQNNNNSRNHSPQTDNRLYTTLPISTPNPKEKTLSALSLNPAWWNLMLDPYYKPQVHRPDQCKMQSVFHLGPIGLPPFTIQRSCCTTADDGWSCAAIWTLNYKSSAQGPRNARTANTAAATRRLQAAGCRVPRSSRISTGGLWTWGLGGGPGWGWIWRGHQW